MVELDAAGSIVCEFGGKEQVPEKARPFFYAMFQLLPNEKFVLANWQGHSPDFGSSGAQLLEFNRAGDPVWSWSKVELISSWQGVLVLDGLDTFKLHDERGGVMQPLAASSPGSGTEPNLRPPLLCALQGKQKQCGIDCLWGIQMGRL